MKLCSTCSTPCRTSHNKFCSLACWHAWIRGKPRPQRRKHRLVKCCPVCSATFEVGGKAGSLAKVFCSVTCRGKAKRKNIDEWPETKLGSTVWRRRRLEVLDRDRRLCIFCGTAGVNTVHHLIPRQYGGTHEMDNLGSVCYHCHNAIDKTILIMKTKNPGFNIRQWLASFMEQS